VGVPAVPPEVVVAHEGDAAVVALKGSPGELVDARHLTLQAGLREVTLPALRGGRLRIGHGYDEEAEHEHGDDHQSPHWSPHPLRIRRRGWPGLPSLPG